MEYTAKITEEDDHWLVEFPDCPGCQTFGDTREEAIDAAREALEGWLETGLEHGDVPPQPQPHRGTPIAIGLRLEAVLRIRWLRESKGWTQAELAKRLGVSQQAIAKLENADGNPTLGTLEAIVRKVGVRFVLGSNEPWTVVPRAGVMMTGKRVPRNVRRAAPVAHARGVREL